MVFESAENAATAAVISMLLEVSGNPKAGNVDRDHDFDDLKYEHFLVSAASSFPAFLKVAEGKIGIGMGVLNAVKAGFRWHKAKNVHFGSFLLLMPLVTAWQYDMKEAAIKAVEKLRNSTWEDSVHVLEAFRICSARVMDAPELSLESDVESRLKRENINLYLWMKRAPKENLIALELTQGYRISLRGAEFLLSSDDVSRAVVELYHTMLSTYPDPLIIAKAGMDVAERVMKEAKEALETGKLDEFDTKLIEKGLNPGTIADLVASSIYLALLEGWKI